MLMTNQLIGLRIKIIILQQFHFEFFYEASQLEFAALTYLRKANNPIHWLEYSQKGF
jgi:hypothetical protein